MEAKLKKDIKKYFEYKEAYYNGKPLISDAEFDEFEDNLINQGFDPTVGYDEIDNKDKVLNRKKMLSLQKYQILDEEMTLEMAQKIYDKLGDGFLSWKYDGMAGNLQYTNGVLTGFSSRGDGDTGRNLFPKLIDLVPNFLEKEITVDVRCEIFVKNSSFEKYEDGGYAHPRNLCAGIVRDENIDDPRKLDLDFAYLEAVDSLDGFVDLSSLNKEFEYKKRMGTYINSVEDLINTVKYFKEHRTKNDFPTDGMVYTSLSIDRFQHNGKYPTNAISIKFKPPVVTSKVTGFKWKLHKTGKYTPKIYFETVIVDGRKISNASGHNIEYLVENDLKVGDEVRVILSNDIIPMVKKVS